MPEVRVGTINTLGPVDLSVVYESISRDKGRLLRTTADSVERSYRAGMAAVLVDREYPTTAVGYVRFVPLIPPKVFDDLVRNGSAFQVVETGTAHIVPKHNRRSYQGQGYYRPLREALYREIEEGLRDQVLVIGTTKNLRVIKSLHDLRERYPFLDYQVTSHDAYPAIKALTCVCNPSFGSGVQHGERCGKRIKGREIIPLIEAASHHGHVKQKEDIPCTMYVSSSDLAQRINVTLLERYALVNIGGWHVRGYRRLIGELKGVGHYD